MYLIALDLFPDMDQEANPTFACNSIEELMKVMTFFFENGYDVLVKKEDEN